MAATENDDTYRNGAIIPSPVSRIRKSIEQDRPKAALGNMRTHLRLEDARSFWISVARNDLEQILEYVETLEAKQAILLKRLENKE